ncbi:MAG UNVERIFIED_CONTAM: NB-ARC domain-containing protein [Rickettsiaceae bacterium]|jgi:GTPase SAR1 family protein
MSVIFYFYLVQNKRPIVRSDLVTPHDDILLKRPELYKTIDSKLKSQHGISRIVLVGIGGSGKTTLAYHYAKSHNGSIVWEIDADNSSNILLSFEKLAIVLATSKADKEEVDLILKISDFSTKIQKLKSFLSKKARSSPNWLIIYNNVDSFEKVMKYFPHDEKIWGNGNIIITTRNSNLSLSNYIPRNNIIHVNELTKNEKLTLFNNIIGEISTENRKYLNELIDKIPPFHWMYRMLLIILKWKNYLIVNTLNI